MVMQVMYSNYANTPDCNVGILLEGVEDLYGKKVYTGDIVLVWHGSYIATDLETWTPSKELTTVLCDQFRNFGTDNEPYVMFYKLGDFKNEYKVQVVKSYKDVVNGEHWTFEGGCSITYIETSENQEL